MTPASLSFFIVGCRGRNRTLSRLGQSQPCYCYTTRQKVWSTVNRRWYKKSRTSVGSPFDHTCPSADDSKIGGRSQNRTGRRAYLRSKSPAPDYWPRELHPRRLRPKMAEGAGFAPAQVSLASRFQRGTLLNSVNPPKTGGHDGFLPRTEPSGIPRTGFLGAISRGPSVYRFRHVPVYKLAAGAGIPPAHVLPWPPLSRRAPWVLGQPAKWRRMQDFHLRRFDPGLCFQNRHLGYSVNPPKWCPRLDSHQRHPA